MTQSLPTGDFCWDKNIDKYTEDFIRQIDDNGAYGCFIECDLDYPKHLHPEHNTFPLCPENICVTEDMLSEYQIQLAKVTLYSFWALEATMVIPRACVFEQ